MYPIKIFRRSDKLHVGWSYLMDPKFTLYFMCLSLRNKVGTRVVVQATLPPLDIMDNFLVPTPQVI